MRAKVVEYAGQSVFAASSRGVGDEADGMDRDVERGGIVSGALAGFAIQLNERAEAMWLAADDGDGERKAERSGADEGCGRSADAEANRQLRLQGTRPNALSSQLGAVLAGPVDMDLLAQRQQKVELLGEEFVVVVQVVAEERIGLDEGAAADDDLRAAVGDEVQRGEVLEDADGIVGAEHCHGAG